MLLVDDSVAHPRRLRSFGRRVLGWPRRHRLLTSLVLIIIVAIGALDVRLFVVPPADKATRTDAVVVLGGDTFMTRLHAAFELVAHHPGAVLVVSTPGENPCPDDVPPGATSIICFRPEPSTTQGEAREAAKLAAQYGWTSMTVVTTADQVWRARLRFSRCWSGDLRVVQAPTSAWVRVHSVPYEMAATVKAEVLQRGC